MREILFRGKSMSKNWVEGSLITLDADSGYCFIAKPYKGASTLPVREMIYNDMLLVDPETVCQFTGKTILEDKLFEGDIVECEVSYDGNFGYPTTAYERMVIIWDEESYSFAVKTDCGLLLIDDLDWENTGIIGNIFDNPELMEGGGSDE